MRASILHGAHPQEALQQSCCAHQHPVEPPFTSIIHKEDCASETGFTWTSQGLHGLHSFMLPPCSFTFSKQDPIPFPWSQRGLHLSTCSILQAPVRLQVAMPTQLFEDPKRVGAWTCL